MKELNKQNQHEIGINIDNLPQWANYIAMDEDGSWFAYGSKPYLRYCLSDWWNPWRSHVVIIKVKYKSCNWKESLYKIERMETNNKKHKWYNEIIAFAEGRVIETRLLDSYDNKWKIDESPLFFSHLYEFRVKPEPKYIPFTFEDREVFRGKWVRRKKDAAEFIIHNISRNYVIGYRWEEAFEELEFIDGTPFGKLEGGSDE